jgi:hypothetical protein
MRGGWCCWCGGSVGGRITSTLHLCPQQLPIRPRCPGVRFAYPCRLGEVTAVHVNGVPIPLTGADAQISPAPPYAEISYL